VIILLSIKKASKQMEEIQFNKNNWLFHLPLKNEGGEEKYNFRKFILHLV
jgi:hypothetical protein